MTQSRASFFRSKLFKLCLGLFIGAALLYLSVRDVSWAELEHELSGISYHWLLIALGLYWTELGLRVMRWQVLLSHLRPPVALRFTSIAFFSGYAANNVLPAKLGEPFRADLLGRLARVSRLSTFGSIIVERLFDMVFILAMAALGIWLATTDQQDTLGNVTRGLVLLAVPVLGLAAVIGILVAKKSAFGKQRVEAIASKVRNLVHGLRSLQEPATYPKLVGGSLVIWFCNCLSMWSILMALNVELGPGQVLLLVGMTGISASIPAAPAGIGTLQYAFYLSAVMFEFPTSAALVAATIVQVILLGSATLAGAIAYAVALWQHLLRDPDPGDA